MKNFQWRFSKTTLSSCEGLEITVKSHLDKPLVEQQTGLHFVIRERVQGTLSTLKDCSQDIILMLFYHT